MCMGVKLSSLSNLLQVLHPDDNPETEFNLKAIKEPISDALKD